MISAGCECKLFGTGLVMSENASDCTKMQHTDTENLKKFLGEGAPLLIGRGTPLPKPHSPQRLRRLDPPSRLRRSTICPSTFIICPPPYLTLLATGLLRGVVGNKNGWTSQTAEFVDNRFTPRYNRFFCFLSLVPQTCNSSATTTLCSSISTTCRSKFFHYSV